MKEITQKQMGEKIEKTLSVLKEELNAVRAGRANPALLDRVEVEYYGVPTPLNQLANVSCPDPRTILVTPFDPKALGDIERGIGAANVGINPVNDGKVVRLAIPQVTEERRKELCKTVKAMGEETKVSVRNLRRHANDEIKKLEKNHDLTEDDARGALEEIQETIDENIKIVDEMVAEKEKEIMEV